MQYLTPAQLRAMDFGVDLSALSDAKLAQHIQAASLAVNSYTLAPNHPVIHDFRGGTITGETHTWPNDPYLRDWRRRVFPYHKPVIEVTQVRIYAGLDEFLELTASEIYYEASEGWIEPASANFTTIGLFGSAMLPFVGLSEAHVTIDYSYGSLYPTVERIYLSETPDLWRATTGFWTADPVAVTVNGTVLDPADYTADPVEGTILMTGGTPPTGADAVEVSYVGTLHPNISRATGITASTFVANKSIAALVPPGVRAVRIAELSIERAYRSEGSAGGGAATVPAVPPEAGALLDEFIYLPVAFG